MIERPRVGPNTSSGRLVEPLVSYCRKRALEQSRKRLIQKSLIFTIHKLIMRHVRCAIKYDRRYTAVYNTDSKDFILTYIEGTGRPVRL